MEKFPLYFLFPAATVAGILFHLALTRRERTPEFVFGVILTYAVFFNIGAAAIMAFYAHAFMAAQTAAYIGWPAGNPFQFEVACANLAFGILGILCIWMRSTFRLATILGYSIFLIGAAYGHLQQMEVAKNYAIGNAGPPLYVDIIVPPVLLALWGIHYVIAKKGTPSTYQPSSTSASMVP